MHVKSMMFSAAVAVMLSASAASAGDVTIASASGKAFVDDGSGFAIAKQGSTVSTGQRVMAMSGDVVLSDASGCTVTVKPGDMLAVNGKALCASAMLPAAQGQLKKSGGRWVWIVGGVVVAVGIAAIVASNNDKKKKTSP